MDKIEDRLENIERLLLIANRNVFGVSEAALFLGLSQARVYHLTSAKEIPHYKKGKSVYFRRDELEEWMTEEKVRTEDEILRKAQARMY